MISQHYLDLLSRFDRARVLVVGDIFLDENVYGTVTEVSLEAPIPIFVVRERKYNPGAAGNAACNVAALGAKTYMVGVIGDDANAGVVLKEFAVRNVDTSHIVVDASRPTNTYGKLRAGGFNIPEQEVLRTDTPRPPFLSGAIEDKVIANIEELASKVDAIVVVDQISSVATARVLDAVVACGAKHKLLTVGDSRGRAGALKGFDVVVPNDREAGVGTGVDVVDEKTLREAGKKLLTICKNALVTRGPKGIEIFNSTGDISNVPVHVPPKDVVDVTGAGDTVTAAVAVTLVAGGSLTDAAVIGNAAAGKAVVQKGVVTVSRAEVEQALSGVEQSTKIKSVAELKSIIAKLKAKGKKVVWTNGCFDILHAGHITYLMRASQVGDVLVVGLNSDESVRKIKGPTRPIIPEDQRALVLSALGCVDFVTVFSEPNVVSILEILEPSVYAKGGDYTIDTIVQEERRLVESYGGEIALIPGVEGRSTSRIIEQISKDK